MNCTPPIRFVRESEVVIRSRPDLGIPGTAPSRWITRERPKIDRIACPWLVRRFIDPRAVFLFVPAAQVIPDSKRLAAIPFDVPDVEFSHHWEKCSFDALLHAFGISTPGLNRLASIVRAADTGRPRASPEASGLLAISLGMSRLYGSDVEMLEAGMLVYDSLYTWCAFGHQERHTWSAHI